MTHRAYRDNGEHLADELRRLDLLIERRLATVSLQNEAAPQQQAARTVYITRQEVDWLLTHQPQDPPSPAAELDRLDAEIDARVQRSAANGVTLALPALGALFALSPWELRAVTVCLGPELRRKYDRLYAYLQDDITRKRPSVDLVLDLLCPGERQRWAALGAFQETAPLLRTGILRKIDDPQSPSGSTGLAQFLALDPRICRFLLDADAPDARLYRAEGAAESDVEAEDADADLAQGLRRLAEHHLKQDGDARPLVFYLYGPSGAGKRELARRTCRDLGMGLLSLGDQPAYGTDLREARLCRAAVHLPHADALRHDDAAPLRAALAAAVADFGDLVFLTGESAWDGAESFAGALFQPVPVPLPDVARGTALWQRLLAEHTAEPGAWAAELATLFRLSPGGMRAAIRYARNRRLMEPLPRAMTLADLSAACRALSRQRLGDLAVEVRPRSGWDDLVLPTDRMEQLREVRDQLRHRHQVYDRWGFGGETHRGKGLSVLFSGVPGTGKTMAAEVLAHDLGLGLYAVDLSGVVSKYIGETEKNLARVFTEARTSNAILFFDEADALFGKRTEVSDAHDRYANIETSYLLQKMEEYEGVVVLATNLRQNLDDAFTRRVRFIIEFPFPEADSRLRIWQGLFPPQAPVAADVDFAALAREFPVAGGSIKNIVLNAAFLAAADGGPIGRRHILRGVRREFEKIGKLWTEPAPADDAVGAVGGTGPC
ncbi:ATP-binding protein [Streptomyces sp. NPDC058257]|uniref:ATP-binding protein n=1 Tax=Streptomyces sp. NPDC058257 TaxID=3346409 RepID=UPI0036E679C2